MTGRRSSFGWVAGTSLAMMSLATPLAPALEDDAATEPAGDAALAKRSSEAVARGLSFLARTQQPDGSWIEKAGRKMHTDYVGTDEKNVGVTALACIAFLAGGSRPGQGEYGATLERGLDWLLGRVDETGYITAPGQRMYEHALATHCLAEMYRASKTEVVREKLAKAVALIVHAQTSHGGWRYRPGCQDADLSVTVCQILAPQAARDSGIEVPEPTLDNAVRYVKGCFMESRGAYYYQLLIDATGEPQRSRYSFALTAAGVTALYGAGETSGKYIDRPLEFLRSNLPDASGAEDSFEYYYGMYFATRAAAVTGGSYWEAWRNEIRHDLLALEEGTEGVWRDRVGPVYATAMACLILQTPERQKDKEGGR